MATANEEFFDALVRHQIGLLRLGGSLRTDVHRLLDATEADLREQITRRLRGHNGFDSPASVRRLNGLLESIRHTRLKSWDQVTAKWVEQLDELARKEPVFTDVLLKASAPVVLNTSLPTVDRLSSIVKSRPFHGKVLREWAADIARADIARIEGQIKIGMVQGESSQQIARRVVGSAKLKGTDGATQITRNQATAITRTAVNAISNQARTEYYDVNRDLFQHEVFVATLDDRTTWICASLDGEIFDVREGSFPPLHFQCRSIRVAVLNRDVIGDRPEKRFTEQQLVREYTQQNRLRVVGDRDRLPRGHKGSYDQFARRRKRELTGTTPAKVTYQQFLARQSVAHQNDILGPTRGLLFRAGKLELKKFVHRNGDALTLAELAGRYEAAFRAAGLNPKDFL